MKSWRLALADFFVPSAQLLKSIFSSDEVDLPVSSSEVTPRVEPSSLTFQDLLFRLQAFWAERGCVIQQPYDVEVGAGTMCPETFLRVLGPKPYRVGYAQPSRRPADGRYGENPNRLFKHTQFQLILKPPPVNVQELYLESLEAIGIDLKHHDLKFEEDNWEWPAGGAWGVGWQVMLDGLEITQFTYFQQCGGQDLDPICAELTYGMERIAGFLQDVDSIYDIVWARDPETGAAVTYGEVRLAEELQFSVYNFEMADVPRLWEHFNSYEAEAQALLEKANALLADEKAEQKDKKRFPLLATYELALKCSNLFNLLDARGAISVTERVGVIGRIRNLAVGVAKAWALQQEAHQQEANQPEANRQEAVPQEASPQETVPQETSEQASKPADEAEPTLFLNYEL